MGRSMQPNVISVDQGPTQPTIGVDPQNPTLNPLVSLEDGRDAAEHVEQSVQRRRHTRHQISTNHVVCVNTSLMATAARCC
jgi:hypothetical protein